MNITPSNATLNAVIAEALEQQKKRADTLELALAEAEAQVKQGKEVWDANSELLLKANEEIERLKNVVEYTGAHLKSWAEKWQRAKTLFEASIEEDGVDTDNLGYSTGRLVELFEIDFTEEVEVTVTITYSGTVTVPKGAEMGDLCLEVEPDWDVNVELDGDTVGNLTLQGTDYDY
jgi:hypothetical protein